jgi:hypothetical protein
MKDKDSMTLLNIWDYDHTFLVGKIVEKIDVIKDDLLSQEKDSITIYTKCGHVFVFFHDQQCCEHVWLDDITPDIQLLVGHEVLRCEKNSVETGNKHTDFETQTATFYKIACVNGWVDITWKGTSNGYYSEGVDCEVYRRDNHAT